MFYIFVKTSVVYKLIRRKVKVSYSLKLFIRPTRKLWITDKDAAMDRSYIVKRISNDYWLDALTVLLAVSLFLGVVLDGDTLSGRVNEVAGSAVFIACLGRLAYILSTSRKREKTAPHSQSKVPSAPRRPKAYDIVFAVLLTAYFVALYIVALPVKPFLHALFWILILLTAATSVMVAVLYVKRRPERMNASV